MKILFLSQGYCIEDQISFHNAWRNAVGGECNIRNIPIRGMVARYGWDGLYRKVIEISKVFCPDLVFFQFFHPEEEEASPIACIEQLRALSPSVLIFGSSGDLFQNDFWRLWTRKIPVPLVDLASVADAFFPTHMGRYAENLAEHGARNIVFLPHAFLNDNFRDWDKPRPDAIEHVITMVGSVGVGLRHLVSSSCHAFHRWQMVDALWRYYGNRFSLYGKGWRHQACKGHMPFGEQNQLYKNSLIGIDARAPYDEIYYASDRPFLIAGSGAALVQYYTPRFDKIFRHGEHVYFVRNTAELIMACDVLLALGEEELRCRGQKVAEFIQARHTVKNRVDTVISVYEALRMHRSGAMSKEDALRALRLWHFLQEVDLVKECRYSILNWRG